MGTRSGKPSPVVYSNQPLEGGRLRLALFEAWNGRCAWCKQALRDSTFVEVDHILPQKGFADARDRFSLPSEFALHELENLAPVCAAGRRCNIEKSNAVEDTAGAIAKMLERAASNAETVRRSVLAMRSAQGFDKAVLHVVSAPLDSPPVADAIRRHGAAIAQRLHAIEPTLLGSYLSVRKLAPGIEQGPFPDHGPDPEPDVLLTLDANGRIAYTVAEAVSDQDFDDVLTDGLELLISELDERIRDAGLRGDDSDGGFNLVGQRRLLLYGLMFEARDDALVFSLPGSVTSAHAASVMWIDDTGEPRDGQSDVFVDGGFEITVRAWLPFDEFAVSVDTSDVEIDGI